MTVYGRQKIEVGIILRKESGSGIFSVHSKGSPQGKRQLKPLVEFFRKQRPWPGRGEFTISLRNLSAVEQAFTTPGVVPGYPELRQRAGIKWDVRRSLWSNAEHLYVWKGMAEIALHQYLRAVALSAQPDLLVSPPEDKRDG